MTPRGADEFQSMNDRVSSAGRFRDNLTVGRAMKGKRHGLVNLTYRTHTPAGETEVPISSPSPKSATPPGPFGISLPPADKLDPVLQMLVERELPLLGAA